MKPDFVVLIVVVLLLVATSVQFVVWLQQDELPTAAVVEALAGPHPSSAK
jgi:hypothetical protein